MPVDGSRQKARLEVELTALFQQAVLHRYGRACVVCGRSDREVCAHHVIPKSRGDSIRWDTDNGAPVCFSPCHTKAHWTGDTGAAVRAKIEAWMGAKRYERMLAKSRVIVHYTVDDLKEIRSKLKAEMGW